MRYFKKIFYFFSLFIAISTFLYPKTADEILKHIPELEKEILKSKDAYRATGLSIAIVKDGNIIYTKSFGTKENGKNEEIDNDTIHQIASLSKTFLSYLIAKLVDEGILSWDMPIHKVLPELIFSDETANKSATLLDLLTHRIGLSPFSGDTLWHLAYKDIEILKALKNLPFKYKFRELYTYQNHMFGAASIIVERVTKKTIAQLFDEKIFKPLGMKTASVGLKPLQPTFFGFKKKNVAYPHDIRDGKVYTKPFMEESFLFPGSTGVNLSIKDAAIWLQFLINDYTFEGKAFLKPETLKFIRSPKVVCKFKEDDLMFPHERFTDSSYDVGMFEHKYAGHHMYSHMSGFNGVRGYLAFFPDEKMGFIILSNYGSMKVSLMPEVIRGYFLDWYFDLSTINWIERIHNLENKYKKMYENNRLNEKLMSPQASRKLSDYIGTYTNIFYGAIDVIEENNQLRMKYREKSVTLNHWNGDSFNIKPYELNPTLNDLDYCPIYFTINNYQKPELHIGQMYEGKAVFVKK
ncbi:MAG: serine hydrolase [Proteobacteria bacterium]|nr:serine hydrolase [Pseudomonadota bacterium]